MALGAQPAQLLGLVVRQAMILSLRTLLMTPVKFLPRPFPGGGPFVLGYVGAKEIRA